MSCINESCSKLIIELKEKKIEKLNEKIKDLEYEIEYYETNEKILKGFLVTQAALLCIAFQIWD